MRKWPSFLLFFLPSLLFADEVFIKGAGSITGRIVEQSATEVVVDVGGGTVGIPMTRVDHIVKAPTDLDEYDARALSLPPGDVEAWRGLARWAAAKGLDRQAREIYEWIVAVAPDDAEAEGALGYVLLDGQWVTRDDAYRANGFVKFDGEWMLPAEAQLRLDQAAAERSAQAAAEKARADELRQMNEDLQARYAAEAAADEASRAEGEAWFYSNLYGWGGWGAWGPHFHSHAWHGSSWHGGSWHGR
jgi:hypothetical protein